MVRSANVFGFRTGTYVLVHAILVVACRQIDADRIGEVEVYLVHELVGLTVLAQQPFLLGRSLGVLERSHQLRTFARVGGSLGSGVLGIV